MFLNIPRVHAALRIGVGVLLLLPAGRSMAQRGVTLYAAGATGSILDPQVLRDAFGLGYGGAVGVGVPITRLLEVYAAAEYQRIPQEENVIEIVAMVDNEEGFETIETPTTGGQLDRTGFSVGVKSLAPVDSRIRPYLLATGGRLRVKNQAIHFVNPVSGEDFTSEGPEYTDWGVQFGAGANYVMSPIARALLEATFTKVYDGTGRSYWGLKVGIGVSPWGRS